MPIAEQEAIAAWLDEKCGEIDVAIAKVDREIELIDELKQSEISRVVTRGLNPDAPLRSSGIDWIGDVPKHWVIAPFKRSLRINNGCDYKHIVSEEGYPVIGSGGQFAFASDYLYDGEVLLLGRKGTIDRPMYFIGKFWTVDTMFYAIPNDNVCCKYMYYQALGFPYDYYSTATALPSMAASDLANNPIIVPPLSEQQAIADYLDKKCAEINRLKGELEKKREALKELRQAIISEVVTGKRKVI
ncbi:MAG: type I restriction endonuclease subunit S [Bacteroides sp.]|nr:type I restriction endonuclease subunit S [Bacteroides sp.]